MAVKDLKDMLEQYNDEDEILYFDSEDGENKDMRSSWITVRKGCVI